VGVRKTTTKGLTYESPPRAPRAGSTVAVHATELWGPSHATEVKEAPRAPRILMVCPISGSRGKEESSPSPPHHIHTGLILRGDQPPPDPPVPHLRRPSIMLWSTASPASRKAVFESDREGGWGSPSAAGSTTPGAADSIQDNQPISLPSITQPTHLGAPAPVSPATSPASTKLPLPVPPALRRLFFYL
jgi:hypothetical protein